MFLSKLSIYSIHERSESSTKDFIPYTHRSNYESVDR